MQEISSLGKLFVFMGICAVFLVFLYCCTATEKNYNSKYKMWLIQDIVNKFWQHTIKAFFNQWITTNVHTYTHNWQILTRITLTIDQKSNKIGNRTILRTNLQNAQKTKNDERNDTNAHIFRWAQSGWLYGVILPPSLLLVLLLQTILVCLSRRLLCS